MCMFSIPGLNPWAFKEEKADTASHLDQDIHLRSCLSLLFFLLPWVVFASRLWRDHLSIVRLHLQRCQHSSFTCSQDPHRQKELEKRERPASPVLRLRRDAGQSVPPCRPIYQIVVVVVYSSFFI